MDFIRRIGIIEAICAVNFLAFVFIDLFAFGIYNSSSGVVFSVDLIGFIPWIITAIPALIAAVYGLLNARTVYSYDDRMKRIVVCAICIVANVVLIGAMTVPNSAYTFKLSNLYSLFI